MSTTNGTVLATQASATVQTGIKSARVHPSCVRRSAAGTETTNRTASPTNIITLVTTMRPTRRDVAPTTQAIQRSGIAVIVATEKLMRRLSKATQVSSAAFSL